jgi:hypothetical protein
MIIPPTPDGAFPDYYQHTDVEYIFRQLAAGESCALVGIGSVGKSNLMQFLTRADVKERYLGPDRAPYYVMVLLNPHQLIRPQKQVLDMTGESWPGYEIMLNRLRRTLAVMLQEGYIPDGRDASSDVVERIAERYNLLFDAHPLLTQTGIRQLEDAVTEVLRLDRRMRIVFMFDEFEEFINLPAHFFQSLRGVRDDYKQRVMYLTASRFSLPELIAQHKPDPKDASIMEGFAELFHGFTHYISRLDSQSARASIERLERRYNAHLQPDLERSLLYTTGRHSGLLRRGFRTALRIYDAAAITDDVLINILLQDRGVVDECQSIFDSLSADEQHLLRQIVNSEPAAETSDAWNSLNDKKLVTKTRDNPSRPVLTIPVFAVFIRQRN